MQDPWAPVQHYRPVVKTAANFLLPTVRSQIKDYIQQSNEKDHVRFESQQIRKDGTVFPVLVDVTTQKDELGEVLYRIVSIQDITQRNQAQEKRIQLERRLLQSQKLESLGHLAGGIAHEFNNILGTIQGNTDIQSHERRNAQTSRCRAYRQ
jgi:two-component system cell cycle sensor histidine kinase/response regulator CckA